VIEYVFGNRTLKILLGFIILILANSAWREFATRKRPL
jgi:hypothetical protein